MGDSSFYVAGVMINEFLVKLPIISHKNKFSIDSGFHASGRDFFIFSYFRVKISSTVTTISIPTSTMRNSCLFLFAVSFNNGSRYRMVRMSLCKCCIFQDFFFSEPIGGNYLNYLEHPLRESTCLIKDNSFQLSQCIQEVGTLHQDTFS